MQIQEEETDLAGGYTLPSQRERRKVFLPHHHRIPPTTAQPRRSRCTPNSVFITALPSSHLPLLSMKDCTSPLFSGLPYGFDIVYLDAYGNSLLFPPKKHLLLVKITGSFLFKVNTC